MLNQARTFREGQGLSLRELAHIVGVAHRTIARLERGETDVSAAIKGPDCPSVTGADCRDVSACGASTVSGGREPAASRRTKALRLTPMAPALR